MFILFSLHYFPLDGVLAGRLFAAFDKDKNGHIDCDEFLGEKTIHCSCSDLSIHQN